MFNKSFRKIQETLANLEEQKENCKIAKRSTREELNAFCESFPINAETMLGILGATTGRNWKTIKFAGKHFVSNPSYEGEMFKCGFALVDETHPCYGDESTDFAKGDEHFIPIIKLSASKDDYIDYYSDADCFDWTKYYLYLKDPKTKSYTKFNDMGVSKSDIVAQAIDTYFQNVESDSEEEISK